MTTQPTLTHDLARGWRQRCPACGEGRLFGTYLKVLPACTLCGEDLHHHRADDFPAYIVIVLLGHILIPLVVEVELRFSPAWWVHALLWTPLCVLLTYWLLPRVKGMIVALQWRMGMHGFAAAKKRRAALSD
jgi:uncharacterized protein (DUF983 family)